MPSGEPTLRTLLTTPFILYVEAVPAEDGWVRKASYPELEGCEIHAATSWDAVVQLEADLPRYLISRIATGGNVPIPRDRPTMGNVTAEEILDRAGLPAWADRLDEPIASLALHHA